MKEHAVVIAGGGTISLMLAASWRWQASDVAIVERRPNQELAGPRAGAAQSSRSSAMKETAMAATRSRQPAHTSREPPPSLPS